MLCLPLHAPMSWQIIPIAGKMPTLICEMPVVTMSSINMPSQTMLVQTTPGAKVFQPDQAPPWQVKVHKVNNQWQTRMFMPPRMMTVHVIQILPFPLGILRMFSSRNLL